MYLNALPVNQPTNQPSKRKKECNFVVMKLSREQKYILWLLLFVCAPFCLHVVQHTGTLLIFCSHKIEMRFPIAWHYFTTLHTAWIALCRCRFAKRERMWLKKWASDNLHYDFGYVIYSLEFRCKQTNKEFIGPHWNENCLQIVLSAFCIEIDILWGGKVEFAFDY